MNKATRKIVVSSLKGYLHDPKSASITELIDFLENSGALYQASITVGQLRRILPSAKMRGEQVFIQLPNKEWCLKKNQLKIKLKNSKKEENVIEPETKSKQTTTEPKINCCLNCNEPLIKKSWNAKYCNDKCRNEFYKKNQKGGKK